MPAGLIPLLAWLATIAEAAIGIALVLGVFTRWAALAGGTLLVIFALSMIAALGLKSPFNYSVFSASAAAFLLAIVAQHPPGARGCVFR